MKTNKTREEQLEERTPDELWLDDGIDPEELIRLDPCREVQDLLKLAGFITSLDEFIAGLPEKGMTNRQEELWLRTLKPQGGARETPDAFFKRIGA